MNLEEMGWNDMDWVGLVEGRDKWTRQWIFGVHKMRWISWLADELSCSMEVIDLYFKPAFLKRFRRAVGSLIERTETSVIHVL